MDSSIKSDEILNSSLQRDEDNKLKLFEKIVYFASGIIGDEVSSILYLSIEVLILILYLNYYRHYRHSKTAMLNPHVCYLIQLHIVSLGKILLNLMLVLQENYMM